MSEADQVCRPSRRHHGADALRAGLMLLGVVLHTASNYQQSPPDGGWPVRDPEQSGFAGLIVVAIHLFRMPAFFVMAGFFAALVFERRGWSLFVIERLRRIALPLLVGWFLLFPIVKAAFLLAIVRTQTTSLAEAVRAFPSLMGRPYADPGPMHLWFLWYLLAMNLLSVPIVVAWRRFPEGLRNVVERGLDAVTIGSLRWAGVPILAMITWSLLRLMPSPFIDTPSSFALDARIFICYAFFYLCGWVLHRRSILIEQWKHAAWRHAMVAAVAFTLAVVAAVVWYLLMAGGNAAAAAIALPLSQAVTAAAVWLLVIGGVSMAERFVVRPGVAVRLFVDASYWIYLTHLPLCILVPLLLRDWHAPAMLKMLVSVAITTGVLLVVFESVKAVLPSRRSAAES